MCKDFSLRQRGVGRPRSRLRYSTVPLILTVCLLTVLSTGVYAQESTASRGRVPNVFGKISIPS